MQDAISVEFFLCSKCQKELANAPQYAGLLTACPYCGNMFMMTGPADTPYEMTPAKIIESRPATKNITTESARQTQTSDEPTTQDTPTESSSTSPDESVSYIVAQSPRPTGLTVIAAMGLIFSLIGLASGLLVLVLEAMAILGESPNGTNGSIYILIRFVILCLFMLCFIQISIGLLKRRKSARRAFSLLAALIILGEVVQITIAAKNDALAIDFIADFFKFVGLAYLLIGVIYLQRKRIKAWFD